MVRSTMKVRDTAGTPVDPHRSVRPEDAQAAVSIALIVAAVEFPVCAAVLAALAAFGVISTGTATLWAALILVPLSITIGFLGFRVGIAGRRAVPAGGNSGAGDLSRVA